MLLFPVKIDTISIVHNELGTCTLVHKFVNGNALVIPIKYMIGDFYIIDLRDTDYDI